MVQYRRNFIPGGTYFFTVTLADRRSTALVDHIGMLRSAFHAARGARPFAIDAIVVLPEHLHAVLTLPANDADFSGRWHVDYVHFNPVKHGLAQRVRDWPYSSFHRHVREGQLPEDWAGDVSEKEADFGEPAGGGSLP